RLLDYGGDVGRRAHVVGERDPAPAARVLGARVLRQLLARPERHDLPARLEEDDVLVPGSLPAERRVEVVRALHVRDAERDQGDALFHQRGGCPNSRISWSKRSHSTCHVRFALPGFQSIEPRLIFSWPSRSPSCSTITFRSTFPTGSSWSIFSPTECAMKASLSCGGLALLGRRERDARRAEVGLEAAHEDATDERRLAFDLDLAVHELGDADPAAVQPRRPAGVHHRAEDEPFYEFTLHADSLATRDGPPHRRDGPSCGNGPTGPVRSLTYGAGVAHARVRRQDARVRHERGWAAGRLRASLGVAPQRGVGRSEPADVLRAARHHAHRRSLRPPRLRAQLARPRRRPEPRVREPPARGGHRRDRRACGGVRHVVLRPRRDAARASRADIPEPTKRSLIQFTRTNWPLAAQMFAGLFDPHASGDEIASLTRMQRAAASAAAASAFVELAIDSDVRPLLPHVAVPALVLHRRGDRTVPIGRGRELASLLPNARFVPLAGDSNLPWRDGQRELFRALNGFLEHDAPVERADDSPLSCRETEVLRLVSTGMSNREIARVLVLSEHTVHRHVANILRKLSQSTRAAAATQAMRAGLI